MSYKIHFQRSLGAAPDRLHFAAHSHHLWPDVTYEAHQQSWLDAAADADLKWERLFQRLIPDVQQQIARVLNLPAPRNIAFAPNTHALVLRLLSCLPCDRPARVLTTDGEFHSFARQIGRLEEAGLLSVIRVPVEPFERFPERLVTAASTHPVDLIFLSHVFFDSGYVVPDLTTLVNTVGDSNPSALVVVDGYHGFMAVPTDLAPMARRAFYLAGGYKYAMAGEGVCFLYAPDGYGMRPRDTGWFAAFGALEQTSPEAAPKTPFGSDGSRFSGPCCINRPGHELRPDPAHVTRRQGGMPAYQAWPSG